MGMEANKRARETRSETGLVSLDPSATDRNSNIALNTHDNHWWILHDSCNCIRWVIKNRMPYPPSRRQHISTTMDSIRTPILLHQVVCNTIKMTHLIWVRPRIPIHDDWSPSYITPYLVEFSEQNKFPKMTLDRCFPPRILNILARLR